MSADSHRNLREVGDSALMLEFGRTLPGGAVPDLAINCQAIATARALRTKNLPGVRDVIATFRSVVVWFDPLSTDVEALAAALREDADQTVDDGGRHHTVPVVYGGSEGPDLEAVASFAGCSPSDVVDRHASRVYRVFLLGFLPGFAYLGTVDGSIAAPRKAVPRLRVRPGAVGIAGRQTGVYPIESPGGWQIIGRTGVVPFDPERTPPSLFAPGDQVQFVPVSVADALSEPRHLASRVTDAGADAAGHVEVLHPGLLTTVQDTGRWGYQDEGVPVSGPMDRLSHRMANLLVGNRPEAATLEVTWQGPELRLEQETVVAVAGADLQATLDGVDLAPQSSATSRAGSVLRFGGPRFGTRSYLAFGGGIVSPCVLGSRSTHVRTGLGGWEGRPLKAGDRLPLGQAPAVRAVRRAGTPALPTGGARLRVLPGPQADHFVPSEFDTLQRMRYTVSPVSDRMGYRLSGGARLASTLGGGMLSDVAFPGGLQIPPSGEPILLMADRPTTGGYPQIAVVITADLPLAGQLAAGDWIEFELCTRADALSALVAQEGKLLAVC